MMKAFGLFHGGQLDRDDAGLLASSSWADDLEVTALKGRS
jgi:hypothetical protein